MNTQIIAVMQEALKKIARGDGTQTLSAFEAGQGREIARTALEKVAALRVAEKGGTQ